MHMKRNEVTPTPTNASRSTRRTPPLGINSEEDLEAYFCGEKFLALIKSSTDEQIKQIPRFLAPMLSQYYEENRVLVGLKTLTHALNLLEALKRHAQELSDSRTNEHHTKG